MADAQVYFDDLSVGQALPELVRRPTPTMLFRFSAVTWNTHRIHYDPDYARSEGHPGVLVQATMHGAFMLQMLRAFVGYQGRIVSIDYANRGRALAGDTLRCSGHITALHPDTGHVYCRIEEHRHDGQLCLAGDAVLWLPRCQSQL